VRQNQSFSTLNISFLLTSHSVCGYAYAHHANIINRVILFSCLYPGTMIHNVISVVYAESIFTQQTSSPCQNQQVTTHPQNRRIVLDKQPSSQKAKSAYTCSSTTFLLTRTSMPSNLKFSPRNANPNKKKFQSLTKIAHQKPAWKFFRPLFWRNEYLPTIRYCRNPRAPHLHLFRCI
jgi:hypothetical protein